MSVYIASIRASYKQATTIPSKNVITIDYIQVKNGTWDSGNYGLWGEKLFINDYIS